MSKRFSWVLIAGLILVLGGCSSTPTNEGAATGQEETPSTADAGTDAVPPPLPEEKTAEALTPGTPTAEAKPPETAPEASNANALPEKKLTEEGTSGQPLTLPASAASIEIPKEVSPPVVTPALPEPVVVRSSRI